MRYDNIVKGRFIRRENRFVATVFIEGLGEEKTHVKNTGRCREILIPDAVVYLEDHNGRMGQRKLRYSLIAVEKETDQGFIFINIDSQAPNQVVREALEQNLIRLPALSGEIRLLKPEQTFGCSRFDFYLETDQAEKAFLEVKGVTLETHGLARFPDAPTERGIKHVEELAAAHAAGYYAGIIFVIQMKGMKAFAPNWQTHYAFGTALQQARSKGVQVMAYDCIVMPDYLGLNQSVEVVLTP